MTEPRSTSRLVLASQSPYRAQLLERLGIPFEQCDPTIDESRRNGEEAAAYVQRLALAKASAGGHPDQSERVVRIGSDQVCINGDQILGKPGDKATARAQLRHASGARVRFTTAVAVYLQPSCLSQVALVTDEVVFRELDDTTIARYVDAEAPLDCAGGFRAEGLGITLFEAIHSSDPTALIGLPLIATASLLREFAGISLP